MDAQFLTAYGTCIAADTFTRGDSATLGSTEVGAKAWTKIGTCTIASGKLAPAASGGAVINAGSLPRIIDVDVTTPAAGNVYPQVLCRCPADGDTAHGTFFLWWDNGQWELKEDNVAVTNGNSLIAHAHNTAYRLRVIDYGDRIRSYVNDVLCADYLTSVHNDQFYCGVKNNAADGGCTYDNFRCYPATITPPTLFSTRPALIAGSGAAIFSDAMTDADATDLEDHNAAWVVEPTGQAFEINTNAARMTADFAVGYANTEASTVDHEIAANVHTPNTEPAIAHDWMCGLTARWTDTNNYLIARLIYTSGRECELWQKVGGIGTLISMTKLPGLLEKNTTYAMKLAVKGADVCVYLDGKLINQAKTSLLTGTKCGIAAEGEGDEAGNRPTWDDVTVKAT